jgi:hypothetical protein
MMAMLDKLKMTDKTPLAAFSTPEAHLRRKFLKGLDIQITAAEAHSNGEPFIRRGKRWVPDADTGEKVLKEVPIRFSPGWWQDETDKLILTVRYGSKRLELKPGKTAIELGDFDNLLPTLNLIKEAVGAGELDKVLTVAKETRLKARKKAA